MIGSGTLWLAVTTDRLELPIAVEDTAEKLAKKLGITISGLFKAIEYCNGSRSGYKIEKVEIEKEWRKENGL